MKKLKYIIAISVLFIAASCGDKYLDTENLYGKSLESYYKTPTDIEEAIAGVYNAIYTAGVHSNESMAASLMSDMLLAYAAIDQLENNA